MALHHVDVHVRDLRGACNLFDALCQVVGYRRRYADDDFVGYEPVARERPRIGFLRDSEAGGSMRLAFSVERRQLVDEAARIALEQGALRIEGPSVHFEYGDDYYAVFFEDAGGNKFEIVADTVSVRAPRIARIWRSRVRPGLIRAYRRYINATGMLDYRATPGNCGAWILSAAHEDYDDVITLSFWEARDSIVGFAGEPAERAQYYAEDEKYLLDFPKEVEHFDID